MVSKNNSAPIEPDTKKKRRVGFSEPDVGIEANQCIKVFLVSSREEVEAAQSFCLDPVDLNQFFGEDGRIYGYEDLKGAKGITDLVPILQSMFGETLVEQKDEFLVTFSRESHYFRNIVSSRENVTSLKRCHDASNNLKEETCWLEVVCMDICSEPVRELYSRLVPLVLLLVDGGSAIDVNDPKWKIYFLVEKKLDKSGDASSKLLGFSTIYHFYHYPDSVRLRISQILVLPPYQRKGYGRLLLVALNSVAVSDENVYDIAAEEPSDHLQCLRGYIDTCRLLYFEPIKAAIALITSQLKETGVKEKNSKFHSDALESVIEDARKMFKISKKQFFHCWEVIVYLNLDPEVSLCMHNYRTFLSNRMKVDILWKDGGTAGKQVIEVPNDYDHDMTFVMYRSGATGNDDKSDEPDGTHKSQEEQLSQLVDERMEEIMENKKDFSPCVISRFNAVRNFKSLL